MSTPPQQPPPPEEEPWSWDLPGARQQQASPPRGHQPQAPQPQGQQPQDQQPRASVEQLDPHPPAEAPVDHDQPGAPPDGNVEGADSGDGSVPDPAPWLPTKVLVIITGLAVLALIITIVVVLATWIVSPLEPLDVPVVEAK